MKVGLTASLMTADGTPTLACFSATSVDELDTLLAHGHQSVQHGFARAALLDPSADRVAQLRAIVKKGKTWRGRNGMWFSPEGLLAQGGTLCFAFPGLDVPFEPRIDDVARHYGQAWSAAPRESLEEIGMGVIATGRLLDRALRDLGIVPDHLAGHSIGEWNALISAGCIPGDAVDELVSSLRAGMLAVPGVFFAAAGCGAESAREAIDGLADVGISHDNCPHQVILCGRDSAIETALTRLRARGVLCQKLSFQSGFHSRFFADYVGPIFESFQRLPLKRYTTPLWSATTCQSYPTDLDAIRALSIEHLVQPVRFRELILALFAKGVRVFVQVGTGSLTQFVEDTLRGKPHMAVAANVKERSGVEQLVRVAAALFTEGGKLDLPLAGANASEPEPLTREHPLYADFSETLAVIERARNDVFSALARAATGVPALPKVASAVLSSAVPADFQTSRQKRTISMAMMPELMDHTFVRQPPGWPILSDLHPVVPLTASLDLMIDEVERVLPGRVAIEVVDLLAHRWIIGEPPTETEFVVSRLDDSRVKVALGESCEATVLVADAYPQAPARDAAPLRDAHPAPDTALDLYEKRMLFHGPAYRGIVDSGQLGSDGIRGMLQVGPGRGALLDNAGQLLGYWFMATHTVDRMAMPIGIDRLRLFGRRPQLHEKTECTVRIRSIDDRSVIADLTLAQGDRLWASIEGWRDRRFETDDRLWNLIQWPEKHLLSDVTAGGFVLYEDRYQTMPTRDRLVRRFLTESERDRYDQTLLQHQRAWIGGRIAGKDAVRHLLWQMGLGPIFPAEIVLADAPDGSTVVKHSLGPDVRLSIASLGEIAVAVAAERRDVGIALERIEPSRGPAADISLSEAELSLVRGHSEAEARARLLGAKRAAARVKGRATAPASLLVRDYGQERFLVGDLWVETRRHGELVISWTQP